MAAALDQLGRMVAGAHEWRARHTGEPHAPTLARECRERDQVLVGDRGERARVDRHVGVRVGRDMAVARVVLAARGHAGGRESPAQRRREVRHRVRIAVEGAIADDGTCAVVEVQYRREREVDAVLP